MSMQWRNIKQILRQNDFLALVQGCIHLDTAKHIVKMLLVKHLNLKHKITKNKQIFHKKQKRMPKCCANIENQHSSNMIYMYFPYEIKKKDEKQKINVLT